MGDLRRILVELTYPPSTMPGDFVRVDTLMASNLPMIPCQRYLFDIPDEVTYLNCAYMSPLMKPVVEAGTAGLNLKAHPWQITPDQFFTGSEEFRTIAARLIGSSADCIAIVPSASYGMATSARNLPVKKGQSVLVLAEQFPSNYYPWKCLAEENGASVKVVSWPEDHDGQPPS